MGILLKVHVLHVYAVISGEQSNDFLKIKVYCVQFIVDSICKIKNRGHQLQNEDMTPFMSKSVQFYIEIMYIIDICDLKNV